MASCEKIDLNYTEGYEFIEWAEQHGKAFKKKYGHDLLDLLDEVPDGFVLTQHETSDAFILDNCSIEYIRERIKSNHRMLHIILSAMG